MPVTKLFEIRDIATKMTLVATQLGINHNDAELSCAQWAGYGDTEEEQRQHIIFYFPADKEGHSDIYHWYGNRTEFCSVAFVKSFFEDLRHGEVIDIEYLLGETDESKCGDESQLWMKGILLVRPSTSRFSRADATDMVTYEV